MGGFDVVIAAIFVVSILVGVMRGFIKEALSVTSWIVAIWLGSIFCAEAGDFIAQYFNIPNQTFRVWAGFTLIFVVTLFLFAFISWVIIKLLVRGPIKATDRILGIASGAARAALIVAAILMVARGVGQEESDWWNNSQYIGKFIPIVDFIEPLIFDNLPEGVDTETPIQEQLQQKVLDGALQDLSDEPKSEPET